MFKLKRLADKNISETLNKYFSTNIFNILVIVQKQIKNLIIL